MRARFGLGAAERLLLLPAGLRPVKDVLWAARAVSEAFAAGRNVQLRIAGPELDADYAAEVSTSPVTQWHVIEGRAKRPATCSTGRNVL